MVRASRAVPTSSRAASSSGSSCGLRNASRKIASISDCVALPPAPCDIVIRSSRTLARARLARSIRSSTSLLAHGAGQRLRRAPALGRLGLGLLVLLERALDPAGRHDRLPGMASGTLVLVSLP